MNLSNARFILLCVAVACLAVGLGPRSALGIVAIVLVVLVLVSLFVGPV
jgi:hypothetical protein